MCISMTKEVFLQLEAAIKCSVKTIKSYCSEQSIPYSTYNYWRKKYLSSSDAGLLAPVSFASQGLEGNGTSSVQQPEHPHRDFVCEANIYIIRDNKTLR